MSVILHWACERVPFLGAYPPFSSLALGMSWASRRLRAPWPCKRETRCSRSYVLCCLIPYATYCDAFTLSPSPGRRSLSRIERPVSWAESGGMVARRRSGMSLARTAMQLPHDHEHIASTGKDGIQRQGHGWGVLSGRHGRKRLPGLKREMSKSSMPGSLPGSSQPEFILYQERWLMLGIVSALALLSDWAPARPAHTVCDHPPDGGI